VESKELREPEELSEVEEPEELE
jgi:hypothetical protein